MNEVGWIVLERVLTGLAAAVLVFVPSFLIIWIGSQSAVFALIMGGAFSALAALFGLIAGRRVMDWLGEMLRAIGNAQY